MKTVNVFVHRKTVFGKCILDKRHRSSRNIVVFFVQEGGISLYGPLRHLRTYGPLWHLWTSVAAVGYCNTHPWHKTYHKAIRCHLLCQVVFVLSPRRVCLNRFLRGLPKSVEIWSSGLIRTYFVKYSIKKPSLKRCPSLEPSLEVLIFRRVRRYTFLIQQKLMTFVGNQWWSL